MRDLEASRDHDQTASALGWRPIGECPDDMDRPGGRRRWRMRDRNGQEFIGRHALFNDSGFLEDGSNREKWPVEFVPVEIAARR